MVFTFIIILNQILLLVPSISDKIGDVLVGLKNEITQDAQIMQSFFQNDIGGGLETWGNLVKDNIVHDAYAVDTFFQNDVNNFFVDTIGGGVQEAASQVKSFFEDTANAVADKATQEANQVKDFFEKTIPGWFGW